MKGNKTAILFSAGGLTEKAREEIRRLSENGLAIICVTADDLLKLKNREDCRDIILEKWRIIKGEIDLSAVL